MASDEIRVVLTDKLRKWIRTILTHDSLPVELREELLKYTQNRRSSGDEKKTKTIPVNLIRQVFTSVREQQEHNDGIYLHELLEGCEIHLPEPETPQRDPQLEARVEKLRAEQANRDYLNMTRNVDFGRRHGMEPSLKSEIKMLNTQLITIFNFILTVVGSFVFAYKAAEYAMEKPNLVAQVGAGMITGTIVFIADLYFLLRSDLLDTVTEEKRKANIASGVK